MENDFAESTANNSEKHNKERLAEDMGRTSIAASCRLSPVVTVAILVSTESSVK